MTITQKDFDVLPLFLSKQADHEIEIKENDVEGIVYICIYNEDEWVGFKFKADITNHIQQVNCGRIVGACIVSTRLQ